MPTGYEISMYRNIEQIEKHLRSIAASLLEMIPPKCEQGVWRSNNTTADDCELLHGHSGECR